MKTQETQSPRLSLLFHQGPDLEGAPKLIFLGIVKEFVDKEGKLDLGQEYYYWKPVYELTEEEFRLVIEDHLQKKMINPDDLSFFSKPTE